MRLQLQQGNDPRRYNLPTVEEIAAVVPGDGSENVRVERDIIVRLQGGGLRRISNLHPSYLPLHYVLFFPHGEEGWHFNQIRSTRLVRNTSCFKMDSTGAKACQMEYEVHFDYTDIKQWNRNEGTYELGGAMSFEQLHLGTCTSSKFPQKIAWNGQEHPEYSTPGFKNGPVVLGGETFEYISSNYLHPRDSILR